MIRLFYSIWVDTIAVAQAKPRSELEWKAMAMFFMTMAMSLNFSLLITFIELISGCPFYDIPDYLKIFPGTKLNSGLAYFILFFLPPLVLNYFLIFYNKRYVKLQKQYPSKKRGILFFVYLMISLWVMLFAALVLMIFL
jgi:hypothetical protein